jgi:hypothetical protein
MHRRGTLSAANTAGCKLISAQCVVLKDYRSRGPSKNLRAVHSRRFSLCELFSTSLKWHFGQMNVSVSRENHEDFRVVTTIGHTSHTGQATRMASAESGWPIEIPYSASRSLESLIKSLRPANAASESHRDDAPRLLPPPMRSLRRGEEPRRPKRRG